MDRQLKLQLLDELEKKAEKVYFDELRKGTLEYEEVLTSPPIGLQLFQFAAMLNFPMTDDFRPNALRHPPVHILVLSQHCLNHGCTDVDIQAALAVSWANACRRYQYYFGER